MIDATTIRAPRSGSVPRALAFVCALALVGVGCGDDGPGAATGTGGTDGGAADDAGDGSGGTGGARPEGILVDLPSGQVATEALDGYCDLLEAITAATAGKTIHECDNPNASTRIVLAAGASYPMGKTLRFAKLAPTPFQLVVDDPARGAATITAAPPWLLDPGDPPTRCLVHVSGGAVVELSDVTLTQDPSLEVTGVCAIRGSASIRRTRVTGFRHGGMLGTCLPDEGCDFDNGGLTAVQVANSLIDGNSTPDDGGGVYTKGFGAFLVVYHSAVVDNTAAGAGGGLYYGGGWNTHIIRASTISGNTATIGGGVMVKFECSNTYLNVFYSTIADNTAQGTGGGIQFEPADLACAKQDVTVYSSIIGANHSQSTFESNINSAWKTDDQGRELGIFSCNGGSFIYVTPDQPLPAEIDGPCYLTMRDPHLGPLTNMGGTGDLPAHPLLAGSPLIDRVDGLKYDDQRDSPIPDVDLPVTNTWSVFDRMADGDGDGRIAADLGAVEMLTRWQAELLTVAAKGPSPLQMVLEPAGFDRGAGMEYAAGGATNEFVTYRLPIAEPGYYDITAGFLRTPGSGTFQLAIAETAAGPWTDLGATQDAYAPAATFATAGPFKTALFAAAGERFLRFTIVGKNPASAGHALTMDYVDARRSTKTCPALQVAAGAELTCALTAAGGVRCWGANDAGQLGDGSTTARGRASVVDALTDAASIAVGARHACALTSAGGVRCWGANDAGQLGDGTTSEHHVPDAADLSTNAKAIAAGAAHTCVLTAAGGVRCWGANQAGQLGDGTTTERHAPPDTDVLTGVKAIAAGGATTCALMATGGVRCWGANTFGQLGDGTTMDRSAPPTVDVIADVDTVSVGAAHACVVTTGGGVRCWGHNAGGELGNGSLVDVPAPPTTDVLTGAKTVSAGANFTCALMTTGGVRCWGYNSDGQIGDDTPNATERMAPAGTDVLADATAIGAGVTHVCAQMTSGGIRCWGANASGQLGDGLNPDPASEPPALDVVRFAGTCP